MKLPCTAIIMLRLSGQQDGKFDDGET